MVYLVSNTSVGGLTPVNNRAPTMMIGVSASYNLILSIFNLYSIYVSSYLAIQPFIPLQWRHDGCHGVSNHQPHHCLLNRLLRRKSKKTSKLCVNSFCVRNSPVTGEFPAQMASNAENVSIGWRHHASSCPSIHTHIDPCIHIDYGFARIFTVPLHSPNGWGCAKGLSLRSEKRWEFSLVT